MRLRWARGRRVLGGARSAAKARKILTGVGLPVKTRGADLEVVVPSFRRDVSMEDDLVEEIIRVWGYDRIPSTLPGGAIALVTYPPNLRQSQTVRRALVGAGLAEVIAYSFSDPTRAALFGQPSDGAPVELLNPLTQDASRLRSHPLEGVLGAVATNVRRQQPDVRVFEVGKTYGRGGGGDTGTIEPRWVAIALTGARGEPGWSGGQERADVYDAKGLAEHVLEALGVRASTGEAGALGGFEPDCHGTLVTESGTILAEFGEVAATLRESLGIPAPVFAAAVSLDAAAAVVRAPTRYQALPRFPAVERELAFVVGGDQTPTAARNESAPRGAAGPPPRRPALFPVLPFPGRPA